MKVSTRRDVWSVGSGEERRGEERKFHVPKSRASSCRGWCESPTKCMMNFRASKICSEARDLDCTRVVFLRVMIVSSGWTR